MENMHCDSGCVTNVQVWLLPKDIESLMWKGSMSPDYFQGSSASVVNKLNITLSGSFVNLYWTNLVN
jgi:hypothetical protein